MNRTTFEAVLDCDEDYAIVRLAGDPMKRIGRLVGRTALELLRPEDRERLWYALMCTSLFRPSPPIVVRLASGGSWTCQVIQATPSTAVLGFSPCLPSGSSTGRPGGCFSLAPADGDGPA